MRNFSTKRTRSQFALAAAVAATAATLAFPAAPAAAADGTWSNAAGGIWSDPLNWNAGAIADGAGFTADFNSVDLPGDLTVTLDTPRTLGNLTFGDVDPDTTPGSWIIGNNADPLNILTLDGGTPTITVNALGAGRVARIDAQINATTLGLTKAGAGTLVLGNTANTGNIIVGAGTLTGGVNASGNAGLGAGQITLQGGATLNSLMGNNNTWTSTNALVVPTGQVGTLNSPNRMQLRGAVTGGGTLNFNVTSTVSRMDMQNSWTGFTGNLNFTGSGTIRLGINALGSGQPNFNAASWASTNMDLGGGVVLAPNTNSGGNTVQIGALSGSSATAALGAHTAGGSATWSVGALNTSTTFAGGIRGSEILTKVGTGTLTLTNTTDLIYTGATNLNAGGLRIDGAKSGVGAVTVNNNTTLSGTGSVAGTTTIASGGHLAAGGTTSVGTLSLATLTLNPGSIVDSEFNGSANDLLNVTTGPLNINGGAVNLFNEGGTTPFATDGTFNLIQYAGFIGGTGLGALAVNNPQAGKTYSFGTDGTFVNLTISSAGAPIFWNTSTGGSWGSAGNWTAGGPPNSVGAFAGLGGGGTPIAAPATVNLDGDKTVGTVSFNSANAFTIAQGTGGSLVLDNASSPATVTSGAGSHTISAPVTLNATGVGANIVNAADTVTVSGSITGLGPITNVGAGSLVLGGDNAGYTGIASASAGKLVLANANALVAGTLGGGAGTVGFGSNSTFNVVALGTGTITTVDAGTISVGGNGASTTFSGSLAGPAALAKAGAGTLTLTGSSSHAGGLAINGGSVIVRAPQTYAGNTTVAAGATLAIDTGAGVLGSITLADGATFSMLPTGSGASASIFPNNPLILAPGATAVLTSTALGNGYNGLVTGDAASTLLIGGQTSVSAASPTQQFVNHLGTVRIDAGSALRFGATNLNNGGPSTTFEVNGTLQTRNGGAVALGAITGTGIISGAGNAAGNVTYTIGGANTSTTFGGAIQNGSAADRLVAVTKTGTGTLTLSGFNSYTNGTTVNAGTLVAANADALGVGALTINDGGTARAQLGLPTALAVNSLTTTGSGKLDMTDNDLVIRTSTLAAVQAQVTAGFNGGTWDGPGIDSSAAATHPNATTALGYGDNAELGLTTFSGVALTGPEIVVKYTYYGDADLTGVVDLDDFGLFLTGYQNGSLPRTWIYGDFDYTGVIDLDDFGLFLYGYQNQGGALSALSEAVADESGISSSDRAAMQAAISAVPEPASLGVLAVAGLGLLRRRRSAVGA